MSNEVNDMTLKSKTRHSKGNHIDNIKEIRREGVFGSHELKGECHSYCRIGFEDFKSVEW